MGRRWTEQDVSELRHLAQGYFAPRIAESHRGRGRLQGLSTEAVTAIEPARERIGSRSTVRSARDRLGRGGQCGNSDAVNSAGRRCFCWDLQGIRPGDQGWAGTISMVVTRFTKIRG
jgi:hypothetical protein